ncbi:MAG: DinB family protein [Vicinamibacteria bacterium]|nr:DinB family protein [Vicinamibacteria bacterium]
MLGMLRDLVAHQGYANVALLRSVQGSKDATEDPEVRELLHHVLVSNRFWVSSILGLPFDAEAELRSSRSLSDLVDGFRRAQALETSWLERATPADLDATIEDARIPGGTRTVAEAVVQVCLHSHGHRAQCAKLLRKHAVTPPSTDFILWAAHRNEADWP